MTLLLRAGNISSEPNMRDVSVAVRAGGSGQHFPSWLQLDAFMRSGPVPPSHAPQTHTNTRLGADC